MKAYSYYATPGARAFGSLGIVPDEVDAYGGLNMAECALMPNGRLLEPATFVQSLYSNQKWGDAPEMDTFLVMAILSYEEKPDVVIIYGVWVHDKDGKDSNLELFYDAKGLMGDPLTRKTIEAMGENELILDTNWPDTIRLSDIDPSILVFPSGCTTGDDPDIKVISAVARQIRYGKKKTKSFLRIEELPTDGSYNMDALVGICRTPGWLKLPEKRLGPSGIAPVQPAFAPVPPGAFYQAGKVFLVGAKAGGLSHGATWRDTESGPLRYGVFARSADQGARCCEMLPCYSCRAPFMSELSVDEPPMAIMLEGIHVRLCDLIDPVVYASEAAHRLQKLDESGGVVRKLTHVHARLAELETIMDMATDKMVFEQIQQLHLSLHSGAAVAQCRALRNEVAPPATPTLSPTPTLTPTPPNPRLPTHSCLHPHGRRAASLAPRSTWISSGRASSCAPLSSPGACALRARSASSGRETGPTPSPSPWTSASCTPSSAPCSVGWCQRRSSASVNARRHAGSGAPTARPMPSAVGRDATQRPEA